MVFNRQPMIRPHLHTDSINTLAALRPGVVISGSSDRVNFLSFVKIIDLFCLDDYCS